MAPPRGHHEEVAGLEVRQHDRRDGDLAGLDLDARQVMIGVPFAWRLASTIEWTLALKTGRDS